MVSTVGIKRHLQTPQIREVIKPGTSTPALRITFAETERNDVAC